MVKDLQKINFKNTDFSNWIWKLVLVTSVMVGSFMRLYHLGTIPDGIHPDEAYAAYNAYSLATYGIDSFGYHNPVYFTAWGGGMNVLNSYLMIPLIKAFGINAWTIRLPQAILSCITIYVFFCLIKKIYNERTASIAAFLLAINPWHIMMTRNNIESGLLPFFFLTGLLFFVKGLENEKWFYASAISYGLCLYAYATIWPVLPFILLVQIIYGVFYKKINLKSCHVWCAFLLLGIIALPLLLFVLVNYDVIPEIRSSILSIPKLVEFRSDDIALKFFKDNLLKMLKMLDTQQDGLPMNSTEKYGMYYRFSNVFMIVGILILIKQGIDALKQKKYDLKVVWLVQLIFIMILGTILHNPHATRLNCIHFIMIASIASGIVELSSKYWNGLVPTMGIIYFISFVSFALFYKGEYNGTIQNLYIPALENCFEDTKATQKEVYVDDSISFAQVLYHTKMPAKEFMESVKYDEYPSAYLHANVLGKYHMVSGKDDLKNVIPIEEIYKGDYMYILDVERSGELKQKGYKVVDYGSYCLVEK